ncbi:dolichyl-P-Man:Man(7)GlcNAc(2)-PP-dolichol alpha-1,6-mannosyltransferase [Mycoblastus sanguinarius]|nr:dolichyl-P-Man:Man(7)GlcNAc(2)-PP-dolichol alpha-1,6-mannosyltransferase [Mycoblastus sanguinarius]
MRHLADNLLSLVIPTIVVLHLFLAPFTKVEESFNIQATHDVLTHGIPWTRNREQAGCYLREHYDHLTFTGPVPRTFVGPLVLAGASWPSLRVGAGLGGALRGQLIGKTVCRLLRDDQERASHWEDADVRITIARAVLGLYNAYCMVSFRNGVQKAFGRNAANWYTIFQASQFHIMYYSSRTLPNFFAFGLTTLAMRDLLPHAIRSPASRSSRRRYQFALTLLTIAGIVFRSEIAVLLACHTLYLCLQPHISLPLSSIIPAGLLGALIGLGLTIPIDSFFWQKFPLWPELTGFIYNIISKQSLNWGTQPWHFYFTSALPRLLFNPFVYQICIPFALSIPILRWSALDICLPNILFLTIYSFQPHKEWRFVIYIIPPFLAVASAGASWIWTRRSKSFVYRVLSLSLVASTLASFMASFGMLAVSRLNYPGADALNRLHILAGNDTGIVKVHMDTLACMTGVTRFMEKQPPSLEDEGAFWVYDKTEDEQKLLDPLFWQGFDYALAENPKRVIGSWQVLETVEGFAGVGILRPGEGKKDINQDFKLLRKSGWKSDGLGELLGTWGEVVMWKLEDLMRRYVTRGWWLRMKMEPRIRILRKQREGGWGLGGEV